jgi:hypothetical protein
MDGIILFEEDKIQMDGTQGTVLMYSSTVTLTRGDD